MKQRERKIVSHRYKRVLYAWLSEPDNRRCNFFATCDCVTAARLLLVTNLPIEAIAESVGYAFVDRRFERALPARWSVSDSDFACYVANALE